LIISAGPSLEARWLHSIQILPLSIAHMHSCHAWRRFRLSKIKSAAQRVIS
jgi:hypothetical protein